MMPLFGLVVGVLAQTCVSMLPPPQAEIEWFRDGRPYARDIPLRSSRNERVYRREQAGGSPAERVVSCVTTSGVTYYNDRIGSGRAVRIPVALKQGASRLVSSATVRRITTPAGAAARALWYSISNPGLALYGLQTNVGLIEVRTPSPSGGFSVLRAVPRDPAPALALAAADSQRRVLEQRVAELEQTVRLLTDSIAVLQSRPPPDSTSSRPNAASERLESRPPDSAATRPYTARDIEYMLTAGWKQERILAFARRACLAFRVSEVEVLFVRAGASPPLIEGLRGACVRALPGGSHLP